MHVETKTQRCQHLRELATESAFFFKFTHSRTYEHLSIHEFCYFNMQGQDTQTPQTMLKKLMDTTTCKRLNTNVQIFSFTSLASFK